MTARAERRSFWTWGYVSDEPSIAERRAAAERLSVRIGEVVEPPAVPAIDDIVLPSPRLNVPESLAGWVSTTTEERVTHTYGGHSLELLKALRGEFDHPPDAVAHPRSEDELEVTLAWCDREGHVAIPYGGGTSVVWGVNVPGDANAAVTIDLDNLNTVVEVDEVSRAARVEAGILGPDLEAALKPLGLTLRHFPQSFPWSTVGGWVATRSGGHYATNHTHIDDFVESTRMLTPKGWFESRRLPGSGAGPSPDRLVLGSEGTLGIISECWLRLQKRPVYRATAGVAFTSWENGCEAVRAIAQAKLWPANLRILDPSEAEFSAGLSGDHALLIIGFESGGRSPGLECPRRGSHCPGVRWHHRRRRHPRRRRDRPGNRSWRGRRSMAECVHRRERRADRRARPASRYLRDCRSPGTVGRTSMPRSENGSVSLCAVPCAALVSPADSRMSIRTGLRPTTVSAASSPWARKWSAGGS